MSEEATPTGTAEPVAAETTPTPTVDFGPLMERFSRFEERLDAMQPTPEAEPEADPYQPLDTYYGDETQAQDARQVLQSILNPAIEQATKPLLDQLQALQADIALGDVEARWPDLADNRDGITDKVLAEAQQLAQQLGDPRLASNAVLIEKLYLAQKGAERAAAETPAGGVPTALEQAGGASPGEPEADLAQSILRANGPRTPAREMYGW